MLVGMQEKIVYVTNESTLGRRCAEITGSRIVTIPFNNPDAEVAVGSEATALLAAWEGFLDIQRQHTRYNSPRRFADGAALASIDQKQPLAVLIFTDRLRAVIVGELRPRDKWYGSGPLSRWLPALDCLTIEQSCIVTDGTDEAIAVVVNHLNELLSGNCLRRIEIKNLEVGTGLELALRSDLSVGLKVRKTAQVRFCRRLRDHDTGEPIQTNSSRTRQSHRRKQRFLEKEFNDELEFVVVTSPDQTDAFVRDAAKIVSQTYQLALDIGLRDDEATRVYLQTLAREGTLRGYMFQSNNTAIAYVVGDVTSGVFHLWATSYLPDYAKLSPGILLLNKAFDALTEEGVELFDFGHGDAEYKRILGNLESQQEDHGIYSAGLTPSAAFLIHDAVENLRKWARDVLVGAGQLDEFRRRWRRFLRRASEK